MESIVLHAPQCGAVWRIDLSLNDLSVVRAAVIAEMLSLLPNLRRVGLQSYPYTDLPQSDELTDAARLVVSGLARNEKASLRHFICQYDCGPEAIVALFFRHSELEEVDIACPVASYELANAAAFGLARLRRLRELQFNIGGPAEVIFPALSALPLLRSSAS